MSFARPEIIRPPSEHASYFLPLTSGCSNNTCSFCAYSFSKLGIRELDEVKQEIDAMSLYANQRMWVAGQPDIVYLILRSWNGKKVFLQDGDALVYPYPKLIEALQYLNQKFPAIERIASYATPRDILRRSLKELKTLKEQKLGILYMGVESGDDEVLQKIQKNADHNQMVEAAKKLRNRASSCRLQLYSGLAESKAVKSTHWKHQEF